MRTFIDPVCGMTVDEAALKAEGYDDVAFCAPGCRSTFLANPSRYTAASPRGEAILSRPGGCCGGHGRHEASTGAAGS